MDIYIYIDISEYCTVVHSIVGMLTILSYSFIHRCLRCIRFLQLGRQTLGDYIAEVYKSDHSARKGCAEEVFLFFLNIVLVISNALHIYAAPDEKNWRPPDLTLAGDQKFK